MQKQLISLLLFLISVSGLCQTKVAILPVIDKFDQVSYAHKLLLRSNITTAIAMTDGYEGYDRIDLSSVMDEQDFQRKGLVSDKEIHEIGVMTGADFVIIAEAAKLDDGHLIASAKIVNVESAKITKSSQTIVNVSDLEQMSKDCQSLTMQLLGKTIAKTTDTHSRNVPSFDNKEPYQKTILEGFVDLGLSVKWAECNLGASSPEKYGAFYAWGETSSKNSYTENNYHYIDNPYVLPLSADIAHVKLGGKCRMPSDTEWTELRQTCRWSWTTYNGVNGYKVYGPNGNHIFLPAGGFIDDNMQGDSIYGFYWSSLLNPNDKSHACLIFFNKEDGVKRTSGNRFVGLSIRPVSE